MRYDFQCSACKVDRELDVKLADAPRVGESYQVLTESLACECGCQVFVRVMDRKTGGFRLNFRHVGL